jgi:hypothetical protein
MVSVSKRSRPAPQTAWPLGPAIVFWDVVPCSLVQIDQCFRGAYCLQHQGPGDEGGKLLWNVHRFLPDYMAQHARRQSSSFAPLWDTEISPHMKLFSIGWMPLMPGWKMQQMYFVILFLQYHWCTWKMCSLLKYACSMKFQVITGMGMHMAVIFDVAL